MTTAVKANTKSAMRLAAWVIETEIQRFKAKVSSGPKLGKAEQLTADESQALCNYVRTLATYATEIKAALSDSAEGLDTLSISEHVKIIVEELGGKQALLDILQDLESKGLI